MRISVKYMGLLLLGALTACHKSEEPTPEVQKQPIVFKSFLKEGNRVTPMTRAIGGDLNQGYLLGGAWTAGAYLPSEKKYFDAPTAANGIIEIVGASGIEMRVDGTPKDPNAQRLYWNTDGTTRHTFYAYTANPSETPAGYGLIGVRKFETYSDASQQGACLLFRQPNDPTKQIDLLTADNSNIVVTPGTTSAVNLYFQHRLSKVSIKVFGTGGANLSNCQAKVTYNTTAPYSGIGNAVYAGVFIVKYASGAYETSADGRLSMHPRHSGTWALGPQFTVSNTQVSELDASDAGSMIFIPQLIASGWASIELEYSVDGSASRNTAKIDLPALGQLYPTKEYALALNLIERSSILTVTSVRLVDWSSQNEIIDNLPGDYSLSLSATKPTDAVIPATGKEYTINVTSNRDWTVSKSQYATVSPLSGKKGTTAVKIKVDAATAAGDRNVYAVFSTVGAAESMASGTWMGTQTK